MSYRYAVLWEHHGDCSRPVGVALERDDHVVVETRHDLHLPNRYDRPFVVGAIDRPEAVTYLPRHPQYFEHVLIDLSRSVAIGERSVVGSCSDPTLLRLLRDKVEEPL